MVARFDEDGFVSVAGDRLAVPKVAELRAMATARFQAYVDDATAKGLGERVFQEHDESMAGFSVRVGGRIDYSLTAEELEAALPAGQRFWEPVVDAIFDRRSGGGGGGSCSEAEGKQGKAVQPLRPLCEREPVRAGIVLSRPGDRDQNWHIDGVHRLVSGGADDLEHVPADRIMVFLPLVDITEENGATEMVPGSHRRVNATPGDAEEDAGAAGRAEGAGGAGGVEAAEENEVEVPRAFGRYAGRPRRRHLIQAGGVVLMDYRLWHRGRANSSGGDRHLMYVKYEKKVDLSLLKKKRRPPFPPGSKTGPGGVPLPSQLPKKKARRVSLVSMGPSGGGRGGGGGGGNEGGGNSSSSRSSSSSSTITSTPTPTIPPSGSSVGSSILGHVGRLLGGVFGTTQGDPGAGVTPPCAAADASSGGDSGGGSGGGEAAGLLRQLTEAEVREHSSIEDCWMIIAGKVYDVTRFADEHPGGPEILWDLGGRDATVDFEDTGHSSDARDMLHSCLVGELSECG